MTTSKDNSNTTTTRKWLRRLLLTLAVVILLPITLFTIGWFNRDSVIDMFQEWYANNTSGTLVIGKVNASFLSGFPNVGFTLKDIKHTNNDSITDQVSTLDIEEARLIIGAGNLLRGDFIFRKIDIKNAVFTSEVISERPLAYHEDLKRARQGNQKGIQLPDWLNPEGATIVLDNVKYTSKDTILSRNFDVHIHYSKTTFKGDALQLEGNHAMNITVNRLGFNTKKGSFLKNAHITGKPTFNIDLQKDVISIPYFPLHINDQTFQLTADLNLSETNAFVFELQNKTTNFKTVKRLLSDSIASKLKDFEIKKPFESTIKIAGKFAFRNNPEVKATYATTNNEIVISDKIHLNNAAFTGNLTTDIYTNDSLRRLKKSPKDIRVTFDMLNGEFEDIKLTSVNSYYQSTPEDANFIEANVKLSGRNETLAKLIDTDNFDFKGGNFQMNTNISGDIPNLYQILNKATGSFALQNTRVILKKNGLQLPIQSISVDLQNENSILRELTVNLPNGENLVFRGTLKSIAGLLSKSPLSPTTSQIMLTSDNLNISEVIAMAQEFVPEANQKNTDRQTLHETLEAVYSQFHPKFTIDIKAMTYKDVTINDVKSRIELTDPETIVLHNFIFNYDDAVTNLKGRVKVYPPESRFKEAIFMNADATSEGSLAVFKELFNIQLFRIDSGQYKFNGKVNGNVRAFNELLESAKGDLTLTNIKLFYPPAEMDIAIDSLALFVDRYDIVLKQFNLEIDDFHPIKLNGHIKEFPNFLLDDIKDEGSVFLKISAPFFDGDQLLTTINSFKDEDTATFKDKKALHNIFKDINKFNPEIQLAIDSFKFRDLITENIAAQVYFENDSILKLDHLNLKYKSTVASAQGEINAHTSRKDLLNENPFNLDFSVQVKGKSADLNDYLKTTNFVFKSGDFEFYGDYKGQSKNLKLLNSEASGDLKIGGTLVDFEAADLQIPVDSLHIQIHNDLATLKTLDIQLPGKSSVFFSGAIDNFSEFINGSTEKRQHSSNFSIYAPYLDTANIKEFLERSESTTKKNGEPKDLNLKKWKEVLTKINTSFYPAIAIQVDTLKHKEFNITDYESQLGFDNKGLFRIQDTKLDFYGGKITMNVDVGIKVGENTPVSIDMDVQDMDLHELVTRFDYFKNDALRQAEHIAGNLNYNLTAQGTANNEGEVNMNSLNGFLTLEINDLTLYDYKPIMENIPLMKAERFKNLRFQPIVQTFEIRNGELIIPRTQIQSSAIHLFFEGRLKLNEYANIWLSIPWKNLMSNDGLTLPEKTTFDAAGAKFYLQFLQNQKSEKARKQKLKVKFRLGNRKLRKLQKSLNH
ncbi:AsmA-like C-terminal region-containing protein [uncultured Gelidibacter sp.]|uniref:AsmA-like C-terminal region-containing protein n=1 Tax=uncultured Gelidibacter sp. TaxID=259318 RepID=UPI00261C610F|nr:AsmA-like C-terminal region-containing protein [uncultured Gelidibacter sp.]